MRLRTLSVFTVLLFVVSMIVMVVLYGYTIVYVVTSTPVGSVEWVKESFIGIMLKLMAILVLGLVLAFITELVTELN